MPKVNTKKKSKAGKPYSCEKCGNAIEPGQQYYEWSFRYGGTHRQHAACGHPRPSQLTQSKMSEVYAAQEAASDALPGATTAQDMAEALQEVISTAENTRDEYQEAYDAIPNPDTEEKISALDDYISTLENAVSDLEGAEYSHDDNKQEGCDGAGDCECGLADWLEEQRSAAQEALDSCSC